MCVRVPARVCALFVHSPTCVRVCARAGHVVFPFLCRCVLDVCVCVRVLFASVHWPLFAAMCASAHFPVSGSAFFWLTMLNNA